MAFNRFRRQKSIGDLEEEKDRLTIEEEVVTKKSEIAEREAVISQLKKQYGSSWAKTLGISKLTDLSTLRSFLVSAKQGMETQASSTYNDTPIGRMAGFKGLPKA